MKKQHRLLELRKLLKTKKILTRESTLVEGAQYFLKASEGFGFGRVVRTKKEGSIVDYRNELWVILGRLMNNT